jgi:hypothetical protein
MLEDKQVKKYKYNNDITSYSLPEGNFHWHRYRWRSPGW